MTMFVAQRGISKIAPSRFWIDKDLVYRQSVLQGKLVFSRSKNIWMLSRHEELNCYKYSRNNHDAPKNNPQEYSEFNLPFSCPHGVRFCRENIGFGE